MEPDTGNFAVNHPVALLALLLAVLAAIFGLAQHPRTRGLFRFIPVLVFCYFVPTTLTTLGVIPAESPLYSWIRTFLLPASLFLLILSLDVPAILRLGWKPVVMMLSGTLGVVVGGPVALLLGQWLLTGPWALPPEAWKGLAALAGSWIGGGANFVAVGDAVGASAALLALMVVPDVLVANIWMGVLLYFAAHQHRIDARRGADARSIRQLEQRLTEFQQRNLRIPTLEDLILLLALGFGASWISYQAGQWLTQTAGATVVQSAQRLAITEVPAYPDQPVLKPEDPRLKPTDVGRAIDRLSDRDPQALDRLTARERWQLRAARFINETTGGGMWKYVLVTTLGLLASLTPMRRLEGAGASRLGSVMLYLLVATIGASADFNRLAEAPGYIVVAAIWMAIHVAVVVTVAWAIRAPVFFMAVGSQANIGGAASAPVVAAAYHPSLAPVGVLLAVAGYVLGTYAGLLCAGLLRLVAGGD